MPVPIFMPVFIPTNGLNGSTNSMDSAMYATMAQMMMMQAAFMMQQQQQQQQTQSAPQQQQLQALPLTTSTSSGTAAISSTTSTSEVAQLVSATTSAPSEGQHLTPPASRNNDDGSTEKSVADILSFLFHSKPQSPDRGDAVVKRKRVSEPEHSSHATSAATTGLTHAQMAIRNCALLYHAFQRAAPELVASGGRVLQREIPYFDNDAIVPRPRGEQSGQAHSHGPGCGHPMVLHTVHMSKSFYFVLTAMHFRGMWII